MRRACLIAIAAALVTATTAVAADPLPPTGDQIVWDESRAAGQPWKGRLVSGVRLPAQGQDFFTWDFPLNRPKNRAWRRWGTDGLVNTILTVLREHRLANPDAPRVGIGDLSRPLGGNFDERYGGLGHQSHQNGLDVDIYYPRFDRRETRVRNVLQIDFDLSQDLVSRLVRAGAQYVFVGPNTGLVGPRRVVRRLRFHDDHLHLRIPRSLQNR